MTSGSEELITGVRQLMHAGRQPLLIMVDPASFGDSREVAIAAESARRMGIPVSMIHYGDSISDALSAPRHPGRFTRAA